SPPMGAGLDAGKLRGMFSRTGGRLRFSSVLDGTAYTLFIGEFLPQEHGWALADVNAGGWANASAGLAHRPTSIPIHLDTRATPNDINLAWGFKSRHDGGANFAFVDGSVHFIRDSINMKTYQLLGCRNDKQVIDQGEY